jgi:homoserine O-acetyltransferase
VLGWSMGAEQTYEWAVRFPDMVKRALPFAGTAKTTRTTLFSFGRMKTL